MGKRLEMGQSGPRPVNGHLQVLFYLDPSEAEELNEVATALDVRRSVVLRSIVHATLQKLKTLAEPPSTLGGIENAIIG